MFLVTAQADAVGLSLARKRLAQNEAGRVVLDEAPITCSLDADPLATDWLASLSLTAQPRAHLLALYHDWIACGEAFQAAHITGRLAVPADAADRARLQRDIAALRAQAEKEKQVNRRVELNLELKRLEAQLAEAATNL